MGVNAANNNVVNTNQYDLSQYDKFARDESGKSLLGRFSRAVAKLTVGGNSHTIEKNTNDRVHAFKRDDADIASNNRTRADFLKAIITKYDGWNKVPQEVKEKINLEDFCENHADKSCLESALMGSLRREPMSRQELFDMIDQKVDSGKPLTARRINKVMAAVNKEAAKLANPIMKKIKSNGFEGLARDADKAGFFNTEIKDLKGKCDATVFKAAVKMLFRDFLAFMKNQLSNPDAANDGFEELERKLADAVDNDLKLNNVPGIVNNHLGRLPSQGGVGASINLLANRFIDGYNANIEKKNNTL